jgi:hypothetical protein
MQPNMLTREKERAHRINIVKGHFVTYFVKHLNHMVHEGPFAGESLALQVGPLLGNP